MLDRIRPNLDAPGFHKQWNLRVSAGSRNYLKTPIMASYPWMGEDRGDGDRYSPLILTISRQRRRDF